MALSGLDIEVVAGQVGSVIGLLLIGVENQWVGSLDVVEDDFPWKNTSLTLWQVEAWEFLLHALLLGIGVINVEDTSGQSRSHLSSIVPVHS